jgi:lipopolysaccharide transport system ATP-binding protein
VAAHLEPEILVVDEVLAVGDQEFQNKCLGKMKDVATGGRTILFVSHNMLAVTRLCDRAILLENGSITQDGTAKQVIDHYFSASKIATNECSNSYRPCETPDKDAQVEFIEIRTHEHSNGKALTTGTPLRLIIDTQIRKARSDYQIAFSVNDAYQNAVFASCPADSNCDTPTQPGKYRFEAIIPGNALMPKNYFITVSLYSKYSGPIHNCQNVLEFMLDAVPDGVLGVDDRRVGIVQLPCQWKCYKTKHVTTKSI